MRITLSLILLAALSACSDNAEAPGDTVDEAAPPETELAVPADFRALADCSARMAAVGRMWGAMSTQSSGDESLEMLQVSFDRENAAMALRFAAENLERDTAPGGPLSVDIESSEVSRIIAETEASIEEERARIPFEEFAVWLGREADRCAPLVPPDP